MKTKGTLRLMLLLLLNAVLATAVFITSSQISENAHNKQQDSGVSASDAAKILEAESITLDVFAEYIVVGNTLDITAQIYPAEAGAAALTWTSSDQTVATVDANGKVTAVSHGCAYITASAANGVCATQPIYVMNGGLVFLSPSRQIYNDYFDGKTTECEQALKFSAACKERLEKVGLEVYDCPPEYLIDVRDNMAGRMGAKCYVAIHTNAAGTDTGTVVYYNKNFTDSVRLAMALYDTVAPLTPDKDGGLKSGVKQNGKMYIEVQYPCLEGVPSILLEVDYHDREESGKWLLNNTQPVADAIADGIMIFMYETY